MSEDEEQRKQLKAAIEAAKIIARDSGNGRLSNARREWEQREEEKRNTRDARLMLIGYIALVVSGATAFYLVTH